MVKLMLPHLNLFFCSYTISMFKLKCTTEEEIIVLEVDILVDVGEMVEDEKEVDVLIEGDVDDTKDVDKEVENEDILVEHRISTYTDGERSATMLVHLKKDGLLWRTETGVTPLPQK